MKKAIIILAAFFINQDTYAASPSKMSSAEQEAARVQLQQEFDISMDILLAPKVNGGCEQVLSDNLAKMGGEMAGRQGLLNLEGLNGQIERNELTMADFDAALTLVRTERISWCSLAYLPAQLN